VHLKTAMSLVGAGSPTSKTLKKRCSSASRCISRSGLIRELNEREPTAEEREKIGSAIAAGDRRASKGRGSGDPSSLERWLKQSPSNA